MTVTEYATRYGLTERAVYHAVYAGRIPFTRHGGRLDLEDTPPGNFSARREKSTMISPTSSGTTAWTDM